MGYTSEMTVVTYKQDLVNVHVKNKSDDTKMNIQNLIRRAETGDVILFDGTSALSELIKAVTLSTYSHVGMIVYIPLPTNWEPAKRASLMHVPESLLLDYRDDAVWRRAHELFLLHATDYTHLPSFFHPNSKLVNGIQLSPLVAYLLQYVGKCYWRQNVARRAPIVDIAAEKLAYPDFYAVQHVFESAQMMRSCQPVKVIQDAVVHVEKRTLFALVTAVCTLQYSTEIWRLVCVSWPLVNRLMVGDVENGSYRSFFCSDLVAFIFQAMGWIKPAPPSFKSASSEMYPPHVFAVVGVADQKTVFGQRILDDTIYRIIRRKGE